VGKELENRRWNGVEVRHLLIMAKNEQDVTELMNYRWPDYEIQINRLPIPAVGDSNWNEVKLAKRCTPSD